MVVSRPSQKMYNTTHTTRLILEIQCRTIVRSTADISHLRRANARQLRLATHRPSRLNRTWKSKSILFCKGKWGYLECQGIKEKSCASSWWIVVDRWRKLQSVMFQEPMTGCSKYKDIAVRSESR